MRSSLTIFACAILSLLMQGRAIAEPHAGLACTGAFKQGGLIICHAPPSTVVTFNGFEARVPPEGLVTFGVSRRSDLDTTARLFRDGTLVQVQPVSLAERQDKVRTLEGLDCDKVDARSVEQKQHASRSWTKKVEAFSTVESGIGPPSSFIRPAEGRDSSPFGPVRYYRGISAVTGEACEKTSVHQGYDIAAPIGTPVHAPAGGVVLLADSDLYYEGGTIFLDHGHGLVSVFMHLSSIDVSVGDTVDQGDLIGAVGNTGRTTGPHLHWSVKWRNVSSSDRNRDFYIDPALLLELDQAVWASPKS